MECSGSAKCEQETCSHYKLHELNKSVIPCNVCCGIDGPICAEVK